MAHPEFPFFGVCAAQAIKPVWALFQMDAETAHQTHYFSALAAGDFWGIGLSKNGR